jgi:predicted metal-dependent hydrolase
LVPAHLGTFARQRFLEWYRAAAKAHLLPRARLGAKSLGVEPRRISIVDNKLRWGSCTPRGTVTLNWRLVKAPMPVADYVAVHELAHLLEPNHGARFWSIVRSQVVGADRARSWLKEHGQLLEQEL